MFIIDDLMALFAVGETAAAATATAEAIALAEAAAAAEAAATAAAAATEAAAATTAATTAAQTAAAETVAAAGTDAAAQTATQEAITRGITSNALPPAAPQVPAGFFEQQLALNPSTMTANPGAGLELASNAPGVNAEMDAVMRFGQNAPQLTPTAPVGPAVPSVPAPTAKLASYGTQPASQFSLTSPTTQSPFSISNAGATTQLPPTTGVAPPGIFDSIKSGFNSLSPLEKGAAMYFGASKLGMFDQGNEKPPADEPMSMTKYRLSDNFQPSVATPRVYQPDYTQYAAEGGVMSVGGVTSYKRGGTGKSYDDSLEYYKNMIAPQEGKGPVPDKGDVGIYHDMDQDTRYQDALTAAQIRQSKINKRANLQMPTGGVMQRPTPMGQLNLSAPGSKAQQGSMDMTNAAGGGIMSLGGYAAGGNPRLLKGPGDGMSDNIPATIGNKQPARLADGEFVIPADVVSHLGNGSTEAGAKRLHEMMTKVRSARTGNSKQGKQINANKYMPK